MELYPDVNCMHFLHYFSFKVQETNDVQKTSEGGQRETLSTRLESMKGTGV